MNRRERAEERGYDPYDATLLEPAGPCPPHLRDAIRRASQYAAEARARDAARKVREETAREWALDRITETRCGT